MKKVIKYLVIIISIILVKLLISFGINEIIINNYNNGIYDKDLIKLLYFLNYPESYIVYYNDGNIAYKKGEYETAVKKYEKSLGKNPPQNRICDIRINLSLALIGQVGLTNKDDDIKKLEDAKNNLYQDNCASATNSSGSSEDAEKLEDEINELEQQIKNNETNSDSQNNGRNDEEKEEDYSDIEQKLKDKEKNAQSSRQGEMSDYENMDDYSYYGGKTW